MSIPPPAPKRSLFQRLRLRLAQLRGGDVIVANVGQGASDVVVGKNILKIGTLVVPALPAVITIVAALISAAVGLWLYLVPATMPVGFFNVAVAEFSQLDSQGRTRVTADSALISRTLFTTIRDELEHQQALTPDYPAVVWNDSMNLLQKRTSIGAITGGSDAQIAAAACQRAEQLNADVIVYGVLDARSEPALLRLQFCARNASRDRDMGNLDALQKSDRLGGPLPVTLPLRDVQSSVNPPLRLRTALLAKLVVGLRYELASNPNLRFSLQQARAVFTDALAFVEQQDGAATSENGGDLIHYFIGRENFLLYQDSLSKPPGDPTLLDAALMALKQATALNADNPRAWNALAAAQYQRAQLLTPAQRLVSTELAQSIEASQAAISAAQAASDRAAEAEAQLALALTYLLKADTFLNQNPSDPAAAEATLKLADQQFAASAPLITPEQNRLRGFDAMVRGLVANERAQIALRAGDQAAGRSFFEQARDSYRQCIAAGQTDPGDQFLRRQLIEPTCARFEPVVTQALERLP